MFPSFSTLDTEEHIFCDPQLDITVLITSYITPFFFFQAFSDSHTHHLKTPPNTLLF